MKGKPFRDQDNRALHERRMKERTRIVVTQKNIEYMYWMKFGHYPCDPEAPVRFIGHWTIPMNLCFPTGRWTAKKSRAS